MQEMVSATVTFLTPKANNTTTLMTLLATRLDVAVPKVVRNRLNAAQTSSCGPRLFHVILLGDGAPLRLILNQFLHFPSLITIKTLF
jgi:hypothetical protein